MKPGAEHGCQACRNRDHQALQKTDTERNTYFDGKASETLTHYICRHCGAKWLEIVESGVGGHGHSWSPE